MVGVKYIASCSFGKDSLAMVLKLIEEGWKLDEVLFYDAGVEFEAIYSIRDEIKLLLQKQRIAYTELKPKRPFMYDMLERPKIKRNGNKTLGDGWCGGGCRWGTINKLKAINEYLPKDKSEITMYVGIAADETNRLSRLDNWKISPLAKWNMTETDCLNYCRNKGFDWMEGGVCLYDLLDRVSCWCCRNKNLKELKNIYFSLPEYWERLTELQDKIGESMKNYRMDDYYGDLGNLHNLQRMWDDESKQMSIFDFMERSNT